MRCKACEYERVERSAESASVRAMSREGLARNTS